MWLQRIWILLALLITIFVNFTSAEEFQCDYVNREWLCLVRKSCVDGIKRDRRNAYLLVILEPNMKLTNNYCDL
ncbi:hypothetical protein PFISCL1PPCAC_17491, partial [Pristionchus fissidentatus]